MTKRYFRPRVIIADASVSEGEEMHFMQSEASGLSVSCSVPRRRRFGGDFECFSKAMKDENVE